MTQFVFTNNVNTTLATAINNTATSITLASAANLPSSIPSGYYLAITLNDAATGQVYEIVYATAISGPTLTVLRGQEGTSAQSWLVGDFAWSGPTAGQMESFGTSGFVNPMTAEGDLIVGTTGGAAVRLAAGTPGYVLTTNGASALPSWAPGGGGSGGVTSFNTRTGAVTLSYGDVTTALGYVPYSTAGGTITGPVLVDSSISVTSSITAGGLIVANSGIDLSGGWSITTTSTTLTITSPAGTALTLSSTGALVATGTVRGGG